MKQTRRELIRATVEDLVLELLHEGRKEDGELPRDAIEEAVRAGEVSVDEMIEWFAEELRNARSEWEDGS